MIVDMRHLNKRTIESPDVLDAMDFIGRVHHVQDLFDLADKKHRDGDIL